MRGLVKVINKINYIAFCVASVLLMIMALIVTYDVLMRYFINRPTVWVNEVSGYLLVITTFIAAGYTLRVGGHVRVDFLDEKLSPRWNSILFVFYHLIILLFVFVLTWQGTKMAWMSWKFNWKASTILGTPLYIPQFFIPLGGLLLMLQVIALILEKLIDGKLPTEGRDV